MSTASCTLVSCCAKHSGVATSTTASAAARDISYMHHEHKQTAVPDSSTFHLALLDNEPLQGCLDPGTSTASTCCIYLLHLLAASTVTADSKTHLHVDQLDRVMGMATMMCFVRFNMMQV